jgi:Zn-dependent membrane protease YugP
VDLDGFSEYFDGSVFTPLILIGAIIALAVRHWTTRWFQRVQTRVADIPSKYGLSGRAIAERLLATCELHDVPVSGAAPTNDYHPWKREIRLQSETHDAATLSALASAAHEVGHAQQFAEKMWRRRLRFVFWPVCWAWIALAPVCAILCSAGVLPPVEIYVSVVVLAITALVVLVQLPISLPLETDATRRASDLARASGLLAGHEEPGFDRVLNAAWKTHAAAAVQRWIILSSIAVAHATRALELTGWKQHEWLGALAAAHAEAGNFEEAVRWQGQCLDRSPAEKKAELRARLQTYEGGQPSRDEPLRQMEEVVTT